MYCIVNKQKSTVPYMKKSSHLAELYWNFYKSKRLVAIPMGITFDRFSSLRDNFIYMQQQFFLNDAKKDLAPYVFDGDTYVSGLTGAAIKKMVKSLVNKPEDFGPEPPSSGQPALL